MSATTSFPAVEAPPLLFGQLDRSPPFSPRSPHPTQTPTSPSPLPMDEPDDVDMTTSLILPAQNHDRQDAPMDDNEVIVFAEQANTGHTNATAHSGEAVTADAMDTTPDGTPVPTPVEPVLPQGTPQVSPVNGGQDARTPSGNVAAVSESQTAVAETEGAGTPPPGTHIVGNDPAVLVAERRQSISSPESPRAESPRAGTSAVDEDRIEEDSSDDDEGGQSWHAIQEDTSTPDDNEKKEIEALRQHSALERKSHVCRYAV